MIDDGDTTLAPVDQVVTLVTSSSDSSLVVQGDSNVALVASTDTGFVVVGGQPEATSLVAPTYESVVLQVPGLGVQGPPGPPGNASAPVYRNFTPSAGQTSFMLPDTPISGTVTAQINNAILAPGLDFTVSGSTVTLLPYLGYTLSPSDMIQFGYEV